MEHHPVCDRKYPTLCDACLAEVKVPAWDDTVLYRIPADVIEAERKVSNWFKQNNIKQWSLGGSSSRQGT